jgi:putative permease
MLSAMAIKNPILAVISNWMNRNFSNPAALGLFFTLLFLLLVIEFFGGILAPILVSIALAYLLQAPKELLRRWYFPNWLAVATVFLLFIGVLAAALFGLVPLLIKQLTTLVEEVPTIFADAQNWLAQMMQKYPHILNGDTLQHTLGAFQGQAAHLGQVALSFSLSSISSLITVVLYLILVPILVFFFLKDSQTILRGMSRLMPSDRSLVADVWSEVHTQLGNYVRGRVIEMIIVGFVSSSCFALLGLPYALLLGVAVGLSVLVPYVGAVLVTIPIVIVGLIAWGLSTHFAYAILIYAIIITLDGNLLAPLLLSEAVDLHPVAVILAVLVFGGIWGFWGVFLAVPLASVVKAIWQHWPRQMKT